MSAYTDQEVLSAAYEYMMAWGYSMPSLYGRIITLAPGDSWSLQWHAFSIGQPVYVRMSVLALPSGLVGTDFDDQPTPYPVSACWARAAAEQRRYGSDDDADTLA